jgi:hypothetical protein
MFLLKEDARVLTFSLEKCVYRYLWLQATGSERTNV